MSEPWETLWDRAMTALDSLGRRFPAMRPATDADESARERAASVRETVQHQRNGIAATPKFEVVKSSAIDTVLAFIERAPQGDG